jgi:signal peptidase II
MESSLKKSILNYLFLLGLAGVIITIDQVTKTILRSRLAVGESWSPAGWLGDWIQIVNTQNTGAAFSLGRGLSPIFTILAFVAILGIFFFYGRLQKEGHLLRAAMGILLGGITGNLIDRLRLGTVTDFFAIRYFAIINVADFAITVGTGLLLLWFWLGERRLKKQGPHNSENQE